MSPSESYEAADLITLPEGNYSLVVSDYNQDPGVVGLDMINLDPNASGRIKSVNVVTRSASQAFKYSLTLGGESSPCGFLDWEWISYPYGFYDSDALPNPYLQLSLIDSFNAEERRIAHNDDWEDDDRSTKFPRLGFRQPVVQRSSIN